MPPRADLKLVVFYGDEEMKGYEGRRVEYEGMGEVLAHLSLKHSVVVVTEAGYRGNAVRSIPITVENLEYYGGLDKRSYASEGPVLILTHDRPTNEVGTGNLDTWEIIPWDQITRLVQNQRSRQLPLGFPHLREPRRS